MFGIGETELVIIVVFAFMLFGPDKLPGMGRTIGRALRQFRTAQDDFTQVVQAEVVDPMTSAMSEPGKKKRTVDQDILDEDADIEGSEDRPRASKGETFAERKARLKAEREAREAAEAAEAAQAEAASEAEGQEGPEADGDGTTAEATDGAAQEDAAKPEDAPRQTSAAALYAMAPRKRAKKAEAADESAPEAEPTPENEDANVATEPAADDAPEVVGAPAPEPAQAEAKTETKPQEEAVLEEQPAQSGQPEAGASAAPAETDADGKEDGEEA